MKRILIIIALLATVLFSSLADAGRVKYSGVSRTIDGTALSAATVSAYLGGTSTVATIYATSTSATSVASVTSDSTGKWTFYIDTDDYGYVQTFKVVVTKAGVASVTEDGIYNVALPTDSVGYLVSDGLGNWSWSTTAGIGLGNNNDWTGTNNFLNTVTFQTPGAVPIMIFPDDAPVEDSYLACSSAGACGWIATDSITVTGAAYVESASIGQVACWHDGVDRLTSCGVPLVDNSSVDAVAVLCKTHTNEVVDCSLSGLTLTGTDDPTLTGGAGDGTIPVDTATDASGEISADGTTGQLRYYVNSAQHVHSPKYSFSVMVPAVSTADDLYIMKAPYGMTLTAIDCIVTAATSATINIQECGADGTSCTDTATSDLACDTDNANTTTFNNASIDSGDWIKLDVASISGSPGNLSVTVTYTITAD